MPTRFVDDSATLIDHIYFRPGAKNKSAPNYYIHSGNFWSDITDHLSNYFLLINSNKLPKKVEPRFVRLYSQSNLQKFKDHIANVNWTDIYSIIDTDTAFSKFADKVENYFNDCFPLVKLSRKHARDKKWMTIGIATSCRTKNRLYRKWIKSRTLNDERKYKNYRTILKRLTSTAELSYYKEQFDVNSNTVKQLWLNLQSFFIQNTKITDYCN
jgi:hypothetical protein